MPLRDHFHPPLDDIRHWEGFLGGWPVLMIASLRKRLPRRYFAEPWVRSGSSREIHVVTCEETDTVIQAGDRDWAPPEATLTVTTDLPAQDVYEVLVFDEKHRTRLVAAVEIVSPANKGRPEHRRAFVAKCAALLRERASVTIVDVVTTRTPNLYAELLDFLGKPDPSLSPEPPLLYAVACRLTKRTNEWMLETWGQPLALGNPLPTMPLWLADNLAVPLELEESYQRSCEILGIP